MSPDKRRLLAKETSNLPYLTGTYEEEAELANQVRNEILELVFDQFIMPDDYNSSAATTSRWKRARQIWKTLLSEKRASYFLDLNNSRYLEWIKMGEANVLPCSTEEIEERNKNLPALQGPKGTVSLAREIRATLLKFVEYFERRLFEAKVVADKRRNFDEFCDTVRKSILAEWFIKKQPKKFAEYEKLLTNLISGGLINSIRGTWKVKGNE
jgi:hypothetical protein